MAKPQLASSRALSKRGYDREPSTVTEYSNGIGSLEEIDPNSGEQGWIDVAKDVGKNANWGAVAANQLRLVPEYMTELLPGIRNLMPIALGSGAKTWAPGGRVRSTSDPRIFRRGSRTPTCRETTSWGFRASEKFQRTRQTIRNLKNI